MTQPTAELVLGGGIPMGGASLARMVKESKPRGACLFVSRLWISALDCHPGPWPVTRQDRLVRLGAGVLERANENQGKILHPLRTGGFTDAEIGVVRIEHVLSMRGAVHETRER